MNINSHIFQTFLIGFLFFPMFKSLTFSFNVILFIFLGLLCGAIYPDTDCKESRIFKMKQDTKRIGWQSSYKEYQSKKNAQSIYNIALFIYSGILILSGNLFRYLLYYPSYKIIYLINSKWVKEDSIMDQHRGISHTIFGIFIASILFFIILFFANLYFNWIKSPYIVISTLTFFIGGNLHLLQDLISKGGIKLFYPFKKTRISGDYSAFCQDGREIILTLALIALNILLFILYYYIKINFDHVLLISMIFLPILFLILSFILLFKSCHIQIN